jgi:hypothetical protein
MIRDQLGSQIKSFHSLMYFSALCGFALDVLRLVMPAHFTPKGVRSRGKIGDAFFSPVLLARLATQIFNVESTRELLNGAILDVVLSG